jgi:hypothetical protein
MTIKESLDRPLSLKDIKDIFPESEYYYHEQIPMNTPNGRKSKKYFMVNIQHIDPQHRKAHRCYIMIGRTTLRDICRMHIRLYLDPIYYDL